MSVGRASKPVGQPPSSAGPEWLGVGRRETFNLGGSMTPFAAPLFCEGPNAAPTQAWLRSGHARKVKIV